MKISMDEPKDDFDGIFLDTGNENCCLVGSVKLSIMFQAPLTQEQCWKMMIFSVR